MARVFAAAVTAGHLPGNEAGRPPWVAGSRFAPKPRD